MFGFGFNSIVNDYKIVRFFHDRKKLEGLNSKVRVVKVYSLSTDSWKELEPGAVQKTRFKYGTVSVSVDGTMTWLGDEDSLPVLVSFDIGTEVFTLTPIPSVVRAPPTSLGVYQNKFVISGYHRESHFMDIWVMEQVASESGKHFSCSEKYSVEIPSYALALDILCIWGNEIVCYDEERKVGVEGESDSEYNLKLFNLTTKEWKESPNFSSAQDCYDGFSLGGSLVSLFNLQKSDRKREEKWKTWKIERGGR
ncbi:hypothetical protein K1719_001666 [Acacia pycnantha]|nr:hypothetical protein K1719_001666 [Acacia pycnantha]